MSILEAALRGGAVAVLLLPAVHAFREARQVPSRQGIAVYALSAAAYVVTSAPGFDGLDIPFGIAVLAVSLGTPVAFWILAAALVDDKPDAWWHSGPVWLGFVALGLWDIFLQVEGVAYYVLALTLVALAVGRALRAWSAIEPRRRIGAVLVAALAIHITAPCQAAEVVAWVSYVEHHDRILPFAEKTATNVRLEVRLSTEGTVQHSEARASGGARGGTRREGSAVLKLGAQQNRSWRVAGPNQLINITDFTSFQRAILVTVSGNSCTARIGYTLKPGFTDYRYHRLKTGEAAVARSVTATDISCSIQ